jgi:hypothetical protein
MFPENLYPAATGFIVGQEKLRFGANVKFIEGAENAGLEQRIFDKCQGSNSRMKREFCRLRAAMNLNLIPIQPQRSAIMMFERGAGAPC